MVYIIHDSLNKVYYVKESYCEITNFLIKAKNTYEYYEYYVYCVHFDTEEVFYVGLYSNIE